MADLGKKPTLPEEQRAKNDEATTGESRLNREAEESATRAQRTQQQYDKDHNIFTK